MTTFAKGRKAILGLAAVSGLVLSAATSQATVVINFTNIWTGDVPGGTGPFGTMAIDSDGADQVKLTITHTATSAAGQFFGRLRLYADPLPGNIAAVLPLDNLVDFISFGEGNDAALTYNIDINFDNAPPADRMLPGMTAIVKLSGTGLTEDDFKTMPGSDGMCYGLLHIQGLANGGSTKLCGELVPEPASFLAIGAGLLLLARRRK